MMQHDQLPPDYRALVHEYGWHVYIMWMYGHTCEGIEAKMRADRANVQKQKLAGRREMPWECRPRQISDLFFAKHDRW